MTTKHTPTPWTVSYMVRERKGDYLAAVEQLEASHEALVAALRLQDDLAALHENWHLGVSLSVKYNQPDKASAREMGEWLQLEAKKARLAALALAQEVV